jgi:hypothetical protein
MRKGSHRGIEHPISEDMAGIGDTRHRLHSAPLPKRGSRYDNGNPPASGSDEARDDMGIGQTMPSDGSC